MYLLPQKMDRRAFVGTSARFYLLLNMVKLPLFLAGAMISWGALKGSLWMWALCPVGVWLGGWLNRRLPERSFIKLLYLFLFLGGAKLVYDGLAR